MGKKRKTNNKDAGKKSKKQARRAHRAPRRLVVHDVGRRCRRPSVVMKFMQKASPAPAAARAAAAPVVSRSRPSASLSERSFGGFNRSRSSGGVLLPERSFYRPPADARGHWTSAAYSQGPWPSPPCRHARRPRRAMAAPLLHAKARGGPPHVVAPSRRTQPSTSGSPSTAQARYFMKRRMRSHSDASASGASILSAASPRTTRWTGTR